MRKAYSASMSAIAGVGEMIVGKGGIEKVAVSGHAVAHRAHEGFARPAADACLEVGRDVGREHRAERRLQGPPAGERPAALGGMAAGAVADMRKLFSPRRDGRIERGGRIGKRRPCGLPAHGKGGQQNCRKPYGAAQQERPFGQIGGPSTSRNDNSAFVEIEFRGSLAGNTVPVRRRGGAIAQAPLDHELRCPVIAAQQQRSLEAPLGGRPVSGEVGIKSGLIDRDRLVESWRPCRTTTA